MSEDIQSLKIVNVLSEVLGMNDICFMRYTKIYRNPDVFTYDHSIYYKEDFGLIKESFCGCGCKSAIYTYEENTGDGGDTIIKTQVEYEELPNQPQPTKEQVKLQTDIIRANREEEVLGIIHGQRSCSEIPVPKLVTRHFQPKDTEN